eukprot:gene7992-10180_t
MSLMKELVLNHVHIALGGKMVPFAGYSMPVQYKGLNVEHMAVRNAAGIFDVSHMGEFFVTGPRALDLIQYVTSNDASKLVDGQVQYSCLPNEDGGIVDDLLVCRYDAEKFLLVVNASNVEKDWNHIQAYNERFGAEGSIDENILQEARDVILGKSSRIVARYKITNVNRDIGTHLSGQIAYQLGNRGLKPATIDLTFTGSAGQSFGAFLVQGVRLTLNGE